MRGLSAEDIPGELVDISIPLRNDINLHRFYKKMSSGNYIIRIESNREQALQRSSYSECFRYHGRLCEYPDEHRRGWQIPVGSDKE